MRNRQVWGLVAIFLTGLTLKVYADSTLTVEDRAKMGEIYSLERLKNYAQAMPKIQVLRQRYPDNREVKSTYARVAGFGGNWKEAAAVFDELCANGCDTEMTETYGHILEAQGPNPETLDTMKKLIDRHPDQPKLQSIYTEMLSWSRKSPGPGMTDAVSAEGNPKIRDVQNLIGQQRFDEALGLLEEILKAAPDDEAALLWKARVLSWQGNLPSSIEAYQKLIKDYPGQVLYYREGARVMGWGGKFWASADLYTQACRRFPDDQALKAEAFAKKAYYDGLFFRAQEGYHNWLAVEPGNPEALFDLGQIHARSGRYWDAQKDYEELLAEFPDNAQAQLARDKADLYAHGWLTQTGFERHESDSKSRQVDARVYVGYEDLKKSIFNNMMFGLKAEEVEYLFSDSSPRVRRHRYSMSLGQSFFPDIFWKLGYGISQSSDDIKDLQYPRAELQIPLVTERFLLNASYNRDDVIQNSAMMFSHLQADQYRARATLTPLKFVEIGADETYSDFTDGNKSDAFGGDVAVHLSYDPRRLTLRYRWQDWRYRENRADYFSPQDFPSQRVSVEWQFAFNKNKLYWGANQVWYLLKYELIMDPGNARGHIGSAGLNWDLNKRLALRGQWQHIYYEHPDIYKDDWLSASVVFNFY